VLGRMTTMPLPEDRLMGLVEQLYRNLQGVREILTDGDVTTVRLVVNAEKMVIAEARRTYTYLSLFGYHVDAVVVNRLIPDEVADPWFDRWKAVQAEHLRSVREGFTDLPVLTAPLFDDELVGAEALGRLADAVYGGGRVHEILRHDEPLRLRRVGDGYLLSLSLPFADRGDVEVLQHGEELYVRVGTYTRSILLSAALRRCEVTGASLTDGQLEVRFAPPPAAQDQGPR
ncbi:MAG: ArsA family ATPase, partial [Actinomycetota bacterium]|nr:ArsA family ATPase [Actinomycetota bacterium]